MDQILPWGLDIVRDVQRAASPALTAVVKGITFGGNEYFFFALLPLIYWCVDKRRGLRISMLVFFSTAINFGLKLALAQPRPYDLDPSVGMAYEPSFGFPSNHAQVSAVAWGSMAPLFNPPWGTLLAIAAPTLVGFSRIYLGVHFPTDVAAGWALGAAILAIDRFLGPRVERFIAGLRDSFALALVAAVALAMNLLTRNDTTFSGAFFGLAGATIYARKALPFSVAGGFGKRVLRYLFGMATVLVVYSLPKLAVASMGLEASPLGRFIRYALLGAWVAAGAPWLFLRMGLAKAETHSAIEKDGSVSSK